MVPNFIPCLHLASWYSVESWIIREESVGYVLHQEFEILKEFIKFNFDSQVYQTVE